MLIDDILNLCCHHLGATSEQLKGHSRHASIANRRHIAIYVMYQCGRWTQEEIAQFFRRDHSTVAHAVEKISDKLRTKDRWIKPDPALIQAVKHLTEKSKEMLQSDLTQPRMDMPGYMGLLSIPRFALKLTDDESGWLYWMWMQRGEIHKFGAAWILNAAWYYADWKVGKRSIGSDRLLRIMEQSHKSFPYIMIEPLAEKKCQKTTTSPASSSAETTLAKSGSS